MPNFYDEDGNLVEGILSLDEVKSLQEEKEARDRELNETKEKLAKLENKDLNFKKLRELKTEELEKLSAKELELMKRQEKLEEDQQTFNTRQIDSYKTNALRNFVGDDTELSEKVLKNYDRIKDEAMTPDEISAKMREAYILTTGSSAQVNPLYSAMGFTGGQPPKKAKDNYADTDAGKGLAAALGMNIAKQ